jgi:hypothetical protein
MKPAIQAPPKLEQEIIVLGSNFQLEKVKIISYDEIIYCYRSVYLEIDLIYNALRNYWAAALLGQDTFCARKDTPEEAISVVLNKCKSMLKCKMFDHQHLIVFLEKQIAKLDKVEEEYKNLMVIKDIIE